MLRKTANEDQISNPVERLDTLSNADASSAAQLAHNTLVLEYGVQSVLKVIPTMVIPNNPASKPVLPGIDQNFSHAQVYLEIFFTLINVRSAWTSIKNLWYADNKNFAKWAEVFFNVARLGLWVSMIALSIAGIVAVAPYLLVAMAALGAGYGLFNVGRAVKELWEAKKNKNAAAYEASKEAIAQQLSITAVSTLSLVFAIEMGIKLPDELNQAVNLLEHGQFMPAIDMFKSVAAGYAGIQILFYTAFTAATLGLITSKSTWDMNKSTINALLNPVQSFHDLGKAMASKWQSLKNLVGSNPRWWVVTVPAAIIATAFEVVSVATSFVARTLAFAATPLLMLGTGMRKTAGWIGKLFSKPAKNVDISVCTDSPAFSTTQINGHLNAHKNDLENRLQMHIAKIQTDKRTGHSLQAAKRSAKEDLLSHVLECMKGQDKTPIHTLETKAKEKANVFQSFWHRQGKTEKLVQEAKVLEAQMAHASRAAS